MRRHFTKGRNQFVKKKKLLNITEYMRPYIRTFRVYTNCLCKYSFTMKKILSNRDEDDDHSSLIHAPNSLRNFLLFAFVVKIYI